MFLDLMEEAALELSQQIGGHALRQISRSFDSVGEQSVLAPTCHDGTHPHQRYCNRRGGIA
jgi:hypothetical protein